MTGWRTRPSPALVFGTTVLVEIAAVGLLWRLEPAYDTILYALYSVAMVGAGALIASRHPDNAIGWLFCGFGLLNAVTNTGIAKRLHLSERTVEAHVRHVLGKLDLPVSEDGHRRVLAVLAHLSASQRS